MSLIAKISVQTVGKRPQISRLAKLLTLIPEDDALMCAYVLYVYDGRGGDDGHNGCALGDTFPFEDTTPDSLKEWQSLHDHLRAMTEWDAHKRALVTVMA